MVPNEVEAGRRNHGRELLEKLLRLEDDVAGAVAPAVLKAIEDPPCNAHGENESLHLGDFRKAALSSAHLLDELARALA